jgi:hypothetical protein
MQLMTVTVEMIVLSKELQRMLMKKSIGLGGVSEVCAARYHYEFCSMGNINGLTYLPGIP